MHALVYINPFLGGSVVCVFSTGHAIEVFQFASLHLYSVSNSI